MKSVPVNFNEFIPELGTVILPTEQEINVCTGTCGGHDLPFSLQTNTNDPGHQGSTGTGENRPVRLQCLPSRTRDLSLLFIGEDENLYSAAFPNLLVDECSCLLQ